jgi:uncharacterized cupredoxin-like copper-binding protein
MNTNNKKFRKSTIVIPALALMVLTVGASATGAVAWFTATRQVTATASTFTAASTTSALTIKTTHGQGTHTSDANNGEANDGNVYVNTSNNTTEATANYLCDASFDAVNDKLYHTVLDDDGKVGSFAEITNNGLTDTTYNTGKMTNDGNHAIYYAVNWQYTFHYETTNPNGSALLFDRTSSFDQTSGLPAGFRIAFRQVVNSGNALYRVWTNSATSTYIKDTTASYDTSSSLVYDTSYDASHIVQTSTSYSRVEDSSISSGNLASLPEYLGTFTSGSSPVNTITIKCTAWYEGTDSSVVKDNLTTTGNPAITANMNFYVRDLA